ncbi:DgyrCDS6427 [Dimorphilus gyrociliatus]|uniref:DgyrCDS6427 n=1 Tax=Dimorphilus gyrociliatus TaxID=2664684 RepID=A0A7I8VPM8_9ANNE|nr:DgyrCDS6427 [Dimorphilus gyrociliatus]
MFSLCYTCCRREGNREAVTKALPIAVLGLDNAGKTVMSTGLSGEKDHNPAPTVGFSNNDFKIGKQQIKLMDLGGGKRVRSIWKNYLSEIYGIIFVIDASDSERVTECREVLNELLRDQRVREKPILLYVYYNVLGFHPNKKQSPLLSYSLANKQDKAGAMDEMDICTALHVEDTVFKVKCPSRIELCSAISYGTGKKVDPAIYKGLCWMIAIIHQRWEDLDSRVKRQNEEHKAEEARKFEEKKARARLNKEEREARERETNGFRDDDDEDTRLDSPDYSRRKDSFKRRSQHKENYSPRNRPFGSDEMLRRRSSTPPPLNHSSGLPLTKSRSIVPPRQLEPLHIDESDGADSARSKKKKKKGRFRLKNNKIGQDDYDTPRQYDYENSYSSKGRSNHPTIDEFDEDADKPHRNWSLDLPDDMDPYRRRPNSYDDVIT